jgi:hypothetical protein
MSSHLTERIAEFVFEELSMTEMLEARQHLAQCADCQRQVEQFQTTHAMLRTSVDVEPPRAIMFEFEKPRAVSWMWRWLAPMAASAAVALAVVSLAPRPQVPIVERVVQQQVAAQPSQVRPVSAEQVDYQKIQEWLTAELNKRDAAREKDVQRVRNEVVELYKTQRVDYRHTEDEIQYFAALKSEPGLIR